MLTARRVDSTGEQRIKKEREMTARLPCFSTDRSVASCGNAPKNFEVSQYVRSEPVSAAPRSPVRTRAHRSRAPALDRQTIINRFFSFDAPVVTLF